ncbi:MAG: 4Fe-4S binding protein [Clostridiaceae bacterium]|nr:4Fe-4S binding protein [Clostridiaceae bacterium]
MPHIIDGEECISCGACAEVCPTEAISEGEEFYIIDAELCIDCGACVEVCPVDCISEE